MKKILIFSICLVFSSLIIAQNSDGTKPAKLDSYQGLSKLAKKVRPDFLLGSFHLPGYHNLTPSDPLNEELLAIFKNNFNIITVVGPMSVTQPEPGKYNAERLEVIDKMVEFANKNNIKVYFHQLFGGATYSPAWINKGSFTKDEIKKIMRERITTILTRYKNKVQYVDVVNEALTSGNISAEGDFDWRKDDGRGDHVWMKTLGMYQGKKYRFPQYLVDAFNISREVGGKKLKLVLNEYNNATTKSPRGTTFLALIKAMKEEGIPVDGAGIQLHCTLRNGVFSESGKEPFDFDAFDAMMKEYEKAGIDVHITEFDIYMPDNPTEADFELQGKYYAEILKHAIQCPAVKSFKTWGFTDKHAWDRGGVDGHPLLLDENFQPKPAYLRQVEMLKSLALRK